MQHEGRQAQCGVSTILEEIRRPIMLGFREHSNNLEEAYSLWCGIPFSKEKVIGSLLVFGDSILVIKAMIGQSNPEGIQLKTFL